jgi:GWxTD domain-containing protein
VKRRIRAYTILAVGLFALAFALSCQSVKGYNSKPQKNQVFASEKDDVDIDLRVYHVNDSLTCVYYRISTENLMFKRIDTTQNFYANLFVACKVLPDINSRVIIDSSSAGLQFKYPAAGQNKFVEGYFSLRIMPLNFAYLDLWIIDNYKNVKYTKPISINKKNSSVGQYFLAFGNDHKINYGNHFFAGDTVTIESNMNTGRTIYVDCFFRDFGPALPPYSSTKPDEFKYKPDSTFSFKLEKNAQLVMPPKGFYHLRTSTEQTEGLSLFTFEKAYPAISDINEMVNSTRYIMNRMEFENCKNSDDKKTCIDNFWLAIGGSNERAKELLRKYYNRVQVANKSYTSYTQGWKTDRGMIYVNFGEPGNIYRSKNEEVWIYGLETDPNSWKFIFKRAENPFSDNDFILQRSYIYQSPWYDMVDYWRQGRITLDK